ncbi:MAG TPA: hypothetical protein VEJ43_13680 [Pseudolabrys sp.]|nr:hypothetical protein [Pseudolabrys sp.]
MALLLSSSAYAFEMTHTPTPQVRVPVTPNVHTPEIHTPGVRTPDASSRIQSVTDAEQEKLKLKKRAGKNSASARLKADAAAKLKDGDADKGRGNLVKDGLDNNSVPNVTGAGKTVDGQGGDQHSTDQRISDVNKDGGPDINLPGTNKQNGADKAIDQLANGQTGFNANLPGSTNPSHIGDADKLKAEAEQQRQAEINQATSGGVNSLNIPTRSPAGASQADGDGLLTSLWNAITGSGGGGGGPAPTAKQSTAKQSEANGTSNGASNDANTPVVNFGFAGSKDVIFHTADGDIKGTLFYKVDPSTGEKTPDHWGLFQKMRPGDDSSGGSVSPGTPMSPNSSFAKKDQGGGTGNNTETNTTQGSQLSPNSALARKGQGDGSDNRGDSNTVGNEGVLATNSSLAKKDQGDGGGSDTRGGNGSTQVVGGGIKVTPGIGGDPHQDTLKALGATGATHQK